VQEKPHIVLTHHTSFGQPRIVGHRLTVGEIVFLLHGGLQPLADFQRTYPDIPVSHIISAIRYCMAQQCRQDIARWSSPKATLQFCHSCTLRREVEGMKQDDVRDLWVLARTLNENLVVTLTQENTPAGNKKRSSEP